jgi:hypothetical protein
MRFIGVVWNVELFGFGMRLCSVKKRCSLSLETYKREGMNKTKEEVVQWMRKWREGFSITCKRINESEFFDIEWEGTA